MNDREMVLEETRRILARLPRPLKKRRRFTPSEATAKALRESGIPEKDIVTLIEGHRHELAFVAGAEGSARFRAELPDAVDRALQTFQEQVSSDVSAGSALTPPTDWTEASTGTFTHAKAPGHKLMVDGQAWRHHLPNGQIAKRGTGAKSLSEYAKTITVGDTGNSGAADPNSESLSDVLNRIRGVGPAVPAGLHARLAEALTRTVQAAPASSGEDLHSRLRAAVTR
jgi:hypothetical protein